MKYFLVVLINIVIFYLIRILSVFIAFSFGVGASASSSKYEIIFSLVDILIQIFVMTIFFLRKKWRFNYLHLCLAYFVTLVLGVLGFMEVIP